MDKVSGDSQVKIRLSVEKTVRSLIQVNKVIAQAGVLKALKQIAVLS
jgi:hypothetical protein